MILAVAALGAVLAAQVISARKIEDPKRQAMGQVLLVEVAPVTQGLILV